MPEPQSRLVQCSTGPFWVFELEQAMDALADAGFKEIELMVTRDPKTQEPDIPLRMADERGLKITSVHGPFLVITKNVWGLDPIEKIRRGVEMCRAVGADTYIVHPPYLWEGSFARWVREDCDGFSEEQGVTVAVETMYPKWVAGRKLRAYRWLDPASLRHAAPHLVLDTSHVAMGRFDLLDALNVMLPKLVHVHLSNNAGDGRDGHLEVDNGVLPLDRFLSELRRTQYAGAVSLELSVNRFLEKPKELVRMLIRNREYVESRWTERPHLEKGLPRR
jgi:sugar phosphate isomerase/epimerase